jgi:hypothetical protein
LLGTIQEVWRQKKQKKRKNKKKRKNINCVPGLVVKVSEHSEDVGVAQVALDFDLAAKLMLDLKRINLLSILLKN